MAEDKNAKDAWDDAGTQLSGLGAKLKSHYEAKRDSGEEQTAVSDALKRLGEAVEDAVGAVGAAAKDPSVKEDVKSAASSLRTALSASFGEISEDLNKRFGAKKEQDPPPRPETPQTPEPPIDPSI